MAGALSKAIVIVVVQPVFFLLATSLADVSIMKSIP